MANTTDPHFETTGFGTTQAHILKLVEPVMSTFTTLTSWKCMLYISAIDFYDGREGP